MLYIFNHLEELKRKIRGRYLFLFLDFDGTLTPIVNTPDRAVISKEAKSLLDLLSRKNNCRIAIISGRVLLDIKRKLGLKDIIYSGNHGFQIEGPKIKYALAVPLSYQKALRRIKDQLKEKLSGIKGVFIEDKDISLAVHFRLADQKQVPFIKTIFHELTIVSSVKNKIKVKSGKKVLEVRPPVQWDKGKVVLWLLARQIFALKKGNILPVYIGDDVTDEDAFKVLKGKGLTVFVGKPGNSKADYYLKNSKEVIRFLRLISELNI